MTNAQLLCALKKLVQEERALNVEILRHLREMERELVKRSPQVLRQERVRPVAEDKVELRMVIDAELKAKLDQLKALRSHKNPNMSYRELLAELADLGLKKWDTAREKSQRSVSGAEKPRMSVARATLTK